LARTQPAEPAPKIIKSYSFMKFSPKSLSTVYV
jgi:hypothetical protein